MTVGLAALYWISTLGTTFLLVFQSRNVNSGRYVAAVLTSWALSGSQLVVVRTAATADPAEVLALTATAAPLGIVAAMLLHRRMFDRGAAPRG